MIISMNEPCFFTVWRIALLVRNINKHNHTACSRMVMYHLVEISGIEPLTS